MSTVFGLELVVKVTYHLLMENVFRKRPQKSKNCFQNIVTSANPSILIIELTQIVKGI